MNSADFTHLSRFVAYAQKRFQLSLLAGCFADTRPQPDIPSRAVGLSLVLGEVVHLPSLLQLQAETQLPQWRQWVGYARHKTHNLGGTKIGAKAWEIIERRPETGPLFPYLCTVSAAE